jgi:hypothetical protein
MASSIDLATVVFTRYASTGERHLGDASGVEGQRTYACAAEKGGMADDRECRVVGNFATPRFMFPQALLHFDAFDANASECGFVLMRKFGRTRT